jgi:hypothetical protein
VEPPVSAVVSRKTHGSAGTFDVALPLTGTPGVECRAPGHLPGGANGDYQLVFTFAHNLSTVGGASVTSGTGAVGTSMIDPGDSHNYIVNLTGVTNAQSITVAVHDAHDAAGANFGVAQQMRVLIGDTNADRSVNSADISQTKAQSGQSVGTGNFREDLNVDGSINSADISLVKSKSGTGLSQ